MEASPGAGRMESVGRGIQPRLGSTPKIDEIERMRRLEGNAFLMPTEFW